MPILEWQPMPTLIVYTLMDASSGLAANSYTLLPSHTQCITVSLTNTTTLINHQHAMHGSQSALAATMYMEANQHWLPL